MSTEEQAAQCRRGIDSTLRSVHEVTACATTAAGLLLHKMNAVLSSVVGTNFGISSYDSIGSLYESIAREKYGMVDRGEDTTILYFARSFAVVIEESVRQLRQANTTTVPQSPPNTVSEASWSCNTTHEDLSQDGNEEERKPATHAAARILQPAAGIATDADGLVGTAEWRRMIQRRHPFMILNFSYKAIEGRIAIHNIHPSVSENQMIQILKPFGLLDFYYNCEGHPFRNGVVKAKLESNQAADAVVAQLDGKMVHGVPISAKRAKFEARARPKQLRQSQLHPSCSKDVKYNNTVACDEKSSGSKDAAAAAKAAEELAAEAASVECISEEKEDSVDDWRGYGSDFSVD